MSTENPIPLIGRDGPMIIIRATELSEKPPTAMRYIPPALKSESQTIVWNSNRVDGGSFGDTGLPSHLRQ